MMLRLLTMPSVVSLAACKDTLLPMGQVIFVDIGLYPRLNNCS